MVVEEEAIRVIVKMIKARLSNFENMEYLEYRRRNCHRDSLLSLERLRTGRSVLGASIDRKSPLAPF